MADATGAELQAGEAALQRMDVAHDFLVSGGEDSCVYIWHRRHRRLLAILRGGHDNVVNSVSWSKAPGGPSLLASASDDHTVAFWSADPRLEVVSGSHP